MHTAKVIQMAMANSNM